MAKEEKKKNPVGRPNQMIEKKELAKKYLFEGWKDAGDIVPSIAGLSCYLGVTRETVYDCKSKDKEYSDILASIMAIQERELLNGTLGGSFNAPFAKLMMTKHGYSDKVEQDVKSSDGSMTPVMPIYRIVNE